MEIWDFMESRCRINPAMTMEMIVMNRVRFLENLTQEYICRRYLKIYVTCKCRNFIILNRSLLVFINCTASSSIRTGKPNNSKF